MAEIVAAIRNGTAYANVHSGQMAGAAKSAVSCINQGQMTTAPHPQRVLAGAANFNQKLSPPSEDSCTVAAGLQIFRRYDSVITAPLTPKIPRPADRA